MTNPTDTAASAASAERAAFEQWFSDSRRNRGTSHTARMFDRREDDTYADDHTQRHWWTWQQARASIAAAPAPEPKPIAYLYHDAKDAASADPLLNSTLLVLASQRLPSYRNETPLYAAPAPVVGVAPAPDYPASPMTAKRAVYFMERFKREEKLLGPNEQAALDFVITMLEATPVPVVGAPPFIDSTAIAMALARPECDHLREFAAVGPVQRAAVQSFADALLAAAPVGAGVPAGMVTVPLALIRRAQQAINWYLEPDSPAEHEATMLELVALGWPDGLAATPQPPAQAPTETMAALSWDGHEIHGTESSIAEVQRLVHLAARDEAGAESNLCVTVGHAKHHGGWCLFEETAPGEFVKIKGPFPDRAQADAVMRAPADTDNQTR